MKKVFTPVLSDTAYMSLALRLARRASANTSPNPLVGAVLVKNGRIIARAYHHRAGLPHAEALALKTAGSRAKGATLYVGLEPCTHYGRTPPCTDQIISAGVKRVVVGMIDPNPVNKGRGVSILRRQGIQVDTGILEDEARRLNEVFITYITRRRPHVSVKVAQSLDGKIATSGFESKWITSERSRELVHRWRKRFDAIMVGVNTVLHDDPLLGYTGRRPKSLFSARPIKIVVDSRLRTPVSSRLFLRDAKGQAVYIATTYEAEDKAKRARARALESKGARIVYVPPRDSRVDLKALLAMLAKEEITSVLVEGGGILIGSLFDLGLVDKVLFFIAPLLIGGNASPSPVQGLGVERLRDAYRLKDVRVRRIDGDILVEASVIR